MKTVSATSEQVIRAYDAYRFRKKKGKIPAYDFQQAKQGPRPPVLCWRRFRPVISAREIPTPTLRHQRSGATSAGGSSEAHTPAYKTITLPGFPNTKHGPEWNPCASPEGEGLSADCAKQSAHMMKQVKKLRTRVSLIKRSLLCSSGQSTQKFQQSAQSREMLRSE